MRPLRKLTVYFVYFCLCTLVTDFALQYLPAFESTVGAQPAKKIAASKGIANNLMIFIDLPLINKRRGIDSVVTLHLIAKKKQVDFI